MLDVYENNYWHEFQTSIKERPITERIDEFLEISRERVSYIMNFKKKCTLLDVGCSMGFLVKAAQDSGFISTGIDLNKKDIDFGIDLFDINLKKQFLGQHQKSKSMLEQMSSRLNNGGIVVVGTHDINCNNHKKEKVNWKHIVPNEHMYYFSKKTLSNLAELVGLKEFYTYKPIDNGFVSFFKGV